MLKKWHWACFGFKKDVNTDVIQTIKWIRIILVMYYADIDQGYDKDLVYDVHVKNDTCGEFNVRTGGADT